MSKIPNLFVHELTKLQGFLFHVCKIEIVSTQDHSVMLLPVCFYFAALLLKSMCFYLVVGQWWVTVRIRTLSNHVRTNKRKMLPLPTLLYPSWFHRHAHRGQYPCFTCPALSWPVLSCPALLTLSCPVLPCHIPSCPVLSYAILSLPALP